MTNLTSARRQVRVGKGELELFGRAPRRRRGVHPAAAVPGPVEGGPLGGGVPGAGIPDQFHAWYAEWIVPVCHLNLEIQGCSLPDFLKEKYIKISK